VAVKLRLMRMGKKKQPTYRVVVADTTSPRDGRFIEVLGTYDPLKNPPLTQFKQERVLDWLGKGAQPSVTVRTLLRRSGVWKQFEERRARAKTAP